MKPTVRYTIIMAVRDGAKWLERALDSVQGQSWRDWELIVQDGGSTDGTLDLLAARAATPDRTSGDERIKVVSEPDGGVYDAWNRALDRATDRADGQTDGRCRADGQTDGRASDHWLLFLGADDALADEHVLARAARELAAQPEQTKFVQGCLQVGRGGEVRETLARSRAEVFRFFVGGMPLLTPAVFFRRDLFASAESGRFDASYRIAGDFAFVAERLRPDNLALLPFVVSYMEAGGLSSSVRSRPTLDAERLRVLREIVLPRGQEIIQACIDTYGDTFSPLEIRH